MNSNKNILILNLGGTFNKVYNQISGNLEVPRDDKSISDILINSKIDDFELEGIIYKDSLEMDDNDRDILKNTILKSDYKKIIIVHGTDTMDKSCEYISKEVVDKQVVFTGSMVPYSIEKTEPVANLMMCYGFLQACETNGVYIGMHGFVRAFDKIKKNKQLGIFECQK